MDSQHKHELQQNDLQEAMTHWRELWDKYGTHILLVVLIVLASVVFFRWYSGRSYRADEAAYAALADNATAIGKREVAEEFGSVPGLAGKAYLEAADLTLREALIPTAPTSATPGDPAAPAAAEPLNPAQVKQKLDEAAGLYQKVIDANESPLQVISARMGLAAVHESLGNYAEAGKQYDQAAELAGDGWPTLAAQAKQLRGSLDAIAKPVTFGKVMAEKKPATPEKPATEDEPAVEDKPATDEKPATEDKPADEDKPTVDEKPATDTKPAADEKPAE